MFNLGQRSRIDRKRFLGKKQLPTRFIVQTERRGVLRVYDLASRVHIFNYSPRHVITIVMGASSSISSIRRSPRWNHTSRVVALLDSAAISSMDQSLSLCCRIVLALRQQSGKRQIHENDGGSVGADPCLRRRDFRCVRRRRRRRRRRWRA